MDYKFISELIKATADFLWPALAFWALWLVKPFAQRFFLRENIQIKIGNMEISSSQATADIGKAVTDIQAKLAAMSDEISNISSKYSRSESFSQQSDIIGEIHATLPNISVQVEANAETRRLRVLWVDDVPSNNAFLIERLRGAGHEICTSLSTTDALSQLKISEFDCIISDLGRVENGIDDPIAGLHLIERVRESGNKIPILIFASHRAKEIEPQLFAAGATNVTTSGIDVISFVDAWAGRPRMF